MNLDGKTIVNGDEVYHLVHGYGIVKMSTASSAVATFNGQDISFNTSGVTPNSPEKMVGNKRPVMVWPTGNTDVQLLQPVIAAAAALLD